MSAFKTFRSIAIFGSADVSDETTLYDQAYQVAQYLAKEEIVVNGGGPGVMLAATLGAEAVGGKTLTISFHPKDATLFEGAHENNLADRNIDAPNYPERVNLLMEHSDAFVILNGGTGTLSEWAMVWLMAHIYYGKHKPFVLVGDFWHELLEVICRHMYIGEEEQKVYEIVGTAEEVIPALQRLEQHLLDLQNEPILTIPEEVMEDASAPVIGRDPEEKSVRFSHHVRGMLAPRLSAPTTLSTRFVVESDAAATDAAEPDSQEINPDRYQNIWEIGKRNLAHV